MYYLKSHYYAKWPDAKIFVATCNVSADTVEVTDLIPHSPDSNGLVYVKRK